MFRECNVMLCFKLCKILCLFVKVPCTSAPPCGRVQQIDPLWPQAGRTKLLWGHWPRQQPNYPMVKHPTDFSLQTPGSPPGPEGWRPAVSYQEHGGHGVGGHLAPPQTFKHPTVLNCSSWGLCFLLRWTSGGRWRTWTPQWMSGSPPTFWRPSKSSWGARTSSTPSWLKICRWDVAEWTSPMWRPVKLRHEAVCRLCWTRRRRRWTLLVRWSREAPTALTSPRTTPSVRWAGHHHLSAPPWWAQTLI